MLEWLSMIMNFKIALEVAIRVVALLIAIVGAYLILSGVSILCGAVVMGGGNFLPGALDLLIGFVMAQTGWKLISFRAP